ncbi:hypothetical protein ABIC50_006775 [Burkholderia sp. 567]
MADAAHAERVDFGQLARIQNVAALFDLLIKPSAACGEPAFVDVLRDSRVERRNHVRRRREAPLRRALHVHPLVVQILVVLTLPAFCSLPIVDNLQIIPFNVKHGKTPPSARRGRRRLNPSSNRKE